VACTKLLNSQIPSLTLILYLCQPKNDLGLHMWAKVY